MRFRRGALDEAAARGRAGSTDYALLTTERAAADAPALVAARDGVVHVPPGKVDEVSAGLLGDVEDRGVVALGGGRVMDTAKAIAGVFGRRCAAVPTTLSGAEMTPFHRVPAGVEGARLVRPALVVADPGPDGVAAAARQLAASAMNALAHAMEALYTPFANPVGEHRRAAGGRAARGRAGRATRPTARRWRWGRARRIRRRARPASPMHHAVCQSVVRVGRHPARRDQRRDAAAQRPRLMVSTRRRR